VTEEGWRLFGERLASARQVLEESRTLTEKDPYWWSVAFTVALGQGWEREEVETLLEEAKAFEPKFWKYDTQFAYYLAPKWYGEKGDWEAYAEKAAARPDGLGDEVYARIVSSTRRSYENVFRETDARWPATKNGLAVLREKYPESLGLVSETALLAGMAWDQELAKEMFDQLGDRCLPRVWRNEEQFHHYKHWAMTGVWGRR
jgi:hypothetical protein